MRTALIKNIIMLFLLFYTPCICFSQDHLPISDPKHYLQEKRILDSLLLCKPAMIEDSNWVNHLIQLGVSYCFFSFDSALLHAKKALELAEKCNNPDLVARSYLLCAIIYDHAKNHPREEYYLEKGLQHAINNKLYYHELNNFRKILNNLYFYKGDYYNATRNSSDGLATAELVNDTGHMVHYNGVLGYIYMKQENFGLSENFYREELNLSKKIKDSFLIGHAMVGLAELAFTQKNYADAKKMLDEALLIYNHIDTSHHFHPFNPIERQAYILNKQALILQATNKLQEAIENSNKAVAIGNTVACNPYDIAEYYITAGSILNDLNRPREAISNIKKGLAIAIDISHREHKQNAYAYLATSYKLLKIYDSALLYQQLYYTLHDSIFNGRQQMLINDITRNKEILLLNQDKKIKEEAIIKQRLIRNVIIGIALFTLIILALLYNRYRIKQKIVFQKELNNQQNESFNAIVALQDKERKRIAQDLHDGLGPVLSAAKIKLTEADSSSLSEKEHSIYVAATRLLDDASAELRNISHNIMPATLSKLGLESALKNLFDSISYSGLAIHFNVHGFEKRLFEETEIALYHIILELVNNVVKHAAAKNLSVQLIKYPQYINLTVEDDGVGFDITKIQSSKDGIGLNSLRSRVELLKGKLEIDSVPGSGTTIIADIPYEK